MSQHIVVQEEKKFVFGWDHPLESFYLQVHDSTRPEDEQIITWLGADPATQMREIQDLCQEARKEGLYINYEMRRTLHGEKDDGR